VESVQGSFGARLFIRDHRKLEDIPRSEVGRTLEDEVKKFQDLQRNLTQKIESLKSEHTGKKKNLFAEMEKKLKEEIEKNPSPRSDGYKGRLATRSAGGYAPGACPHDPHPAPTRQKGLIQPPVANRNVGSVTAWTSLQRVPAALYFRKKIRKDLQTVSSMRT